MVNRFFEIIEENFFRKSVDSLRGTYPRIDEIADDINWALQKNPFWGTIIEEIGERETRVLHTMGIGITPAFWVLFEIDKQKEEVTLLDIHPLQENQND